MGRSTLIYLFVVALFAGCYNSFERASTDFEAEEEGYNITLQRLHEVTASQDYFDVSSDATVQGVVTANDVGGNFYNCFIIEQGGYALQILEGLNYNYVRYPEGSVVSVQLNGLRLARSYGVLQVGLAGAVGSYYDLDYLRHELLVDQHISNSGVGECVEPLKVTLEQLYAGEGYESMCGRLVSVEGVRFQSEEYDFDDWLWSGSRIFVDAQENEMSCYTSSYAYYSALEIEEGYGTMTGILEYDSANRVMIQMRSVADFTLD